MKLRDAATIWLTVQTIKKLKEESRKTGKSNSRVIDRITQDIPNKKKAGN